eukprot:COSAG01_NODE_5625_length_4138_cov_8.799455_2_plen_560_part_00
MAASDPRRRPADPRLAGGGAVIASTSGAARGGGGGAAVAQLPASSAAAVGVAAAATAAAVTTAEIRATKRPRLCGPPPEPSDMATAGERPPAQAQVDSRGSLTTECVMKLENRAAALEAQADFHEQPPLDPRRPPPRDPRRRPVTASDPRRRPADPRLAGGGAVIASTSGAARGGGGGAAIAQLSASSAAAVGVAAAAAAAAVTTAEIKGFRGWSTEAATVSASASRATASPVAARRPAAGVCELVLVRGGGTGAEGATAAAMEEGGLVSGRVRLKPASGSKAPKARRPPTSLSVQTERVLALRGCSPVLCRMQHWLLEPLGNHSRGGADGGWWPQLLSAIGGSRGVAVGSVRGGNSSGHHGCFYLTEKRLYYSDEGALHQGWEALTMTAARGGAAAARVAPARARQQTMLRERPVLAAKAAVSGLKRKRPAPRPATKGLAATGQTVVQAVKRRVVAASGSLRAVAGPAAPSAAPVVMAPSGAPLPLGTFTLGNPAGHSKPSAPPAALKPAGAAADAAEHNIRLKVRHPPSSDAPRGRVQHVRVKLHEPLTKLYEHFGA